MEGCKAVLEVSVGDLAVRVLVGDTLESIPSFLASRTSQSCDGVNPSYDQRMEPHPAQESHNPQSALGFEPLEPRVLKTTCSSWSLVWAFFFILLRNVFGFGFLLFSFDIWTYLFSVLVPVVLSCANAKASQNGLM